MRLKLFLFLTAGLLLLSGILMAEEPTGLQIAQMVDNANISKSGMLVKGQIELKDLKTQAVEKRSYAMISALEGSLKRMLFRFTDSSHKGTTFLSMEKPTGEKIQYMYLKSIGSARQVEGSDKESSFLDTDVSNEDLGGLNIADYSYQRIEDKTVNEKSCYVIQRTPVKKSSKYGKVVVVIEKETLIPVDVRFYTKDSRLVKTVRSQDIRKIGDVNMPFQIIATSISDRHQTSIIIKEAVEKTTPLQFFAKERMGSPWGLE